ncbi:MAG: class I SAM-dependent methyltransferase [Sulfitobacter sp.]
MSDQLSPEDLIRLCYLGVLGREAESEAVIAERMQLNMPPEEVIRSFVMSEEFRNQVTPGIVSEYLTHNQTYDTLDIEVDVDPATLAHMFERIKGEWAALGETEPYWSVLTADEFRRENVQANLDRFFQSGHGNVEWMRNVARRNGIELGAHQSCFELGCGVGRVTLPLSTLFDHVTAFDISPGNLRECEAVMNARGQTNVSTHLLTGIEALRDVQPFDVLFTIIVLQHNPPPVQKYILDVLLDKVNPGGVTYFQLPTYMHGYSFSAQAYLEDIAHEMEMHALPMQQVMTLFHDKGFRVQEVIQDQFTGIAGSHTFLATKTA